MAKLKPAIKKLWVKALRSGKYEQGKGALCQNERFCCLGVLCDLHRIKVKKVRKNKAWEDYCTSSSRKMYEREINVLPTVVSEWAFKDGEAEDNPDITHAKGVCLAGINDKGVSFKEIADVIEEQL